MISAYGWQQSHLRAQLIKAKMNGWFEYFKSASANHSIPLSILLAIASRETNISNIKGDSGHGRGIMQIDDRYHSKFISHNKEGLDPESNIDYAASLLRSNIDRVANEFNSSDYNITLKPAISGYNGSLAKVIALVHNGKDPDQATTKKNYAADVLARREVFDKLLNEGIDA